VSGKAGNKMKTLDKYGRIWDNSIWDKCPICGQPDNCSDCNHKPLTEANVIELSGIIPVEKPEVQYGIRPIK